MRNFKLFVLLFSVLTVTLFSCSKDDSKNPANDIMGTYDFVSVHVKAVNDQTATSMGERSRTKTQFEYTSENNTGIVEVDSKYFTSTDIAYYVNTMLVAYFYDGDEIADSQEMPFEIDVPVSSGKSGYTITGNSKIKVEAGSVFMEGADVMYSQPLEGTYSLDGDILMITANLRETINNNTGGMVVVNSVTGDVVVTLRKK